MTPFPLERLKSSRIVQALLVYLGAAWVVLQLAEALTGLLELPAWVGPVVVIFLGIGFVVVLATAWVQALPETTAKERTGEVPTDWQVKPGDVLASLRRGRLPHLTWGRALVGGVVALSILFGVAGIFVAVGGNASRSSTATGDGTEPLRGITVLPFHVTGPQLELYREGMVDLVSANLDGLSGYRAVDPRTLLSRWERAVGDGGTPELAEALDVAAGTGARYAVVGSGVELGGQIRFTADIYDLETRENVGDGQVQGSPQDVLSLVDELTVEVMRSILEVAGEQSVVQDFRMASLLTGSIPALRAYLEGDADFRRADFVAAREHLQEAVRQDSAFALAHWRLGDTYGWTDGINSEGAERHRMLAARYGDRLPAREVALLDLQGAVTTGQGIHRLQEFRAFVDRYPDDPDGWYLLGEVGLHNIGPPGMPDDELEEAIYTAVALDPSFAPYYVHALDWPIADDDSARARAFLDEWADLGPPEASLEQMRVGADLFIGDDGARAAALDRLPALSLDQLNSIYTSKLEITDHGLPMVEAVGREMGRRAGNMFTRLRIPLAQQGRFEELRELADRQPTPFTRFAARNWLFLYQWGWGLIDEDLVRATRDSLEALPQSQAPASARVVLQANLALFAGDTDSYIDVMGVADPPPALLETVGGPDGWNAMVQVFVLAERDQWEEAAGVIRDAPEICHFPNFLMACAEIARESGNTEGALEYYGGLLRWGAARSLAHYNLGRLAEERGDEATALEHYRALLLRMERADTRIPQLEWARRYVTDYVGGRGG